MSWKLVLTSLLALCVVTGEASAIVIDNFDVAQLVVAAPPSTVSDEVGGVTILGLERDVVAVADVGFGATVVVVDEFGNGLMGYEQGWDNGSGLLTWDGADSSILLDPVGLGGVDLTDLGLSDAFAIDIAFLDSDVTLELTVHTDGTNQSQWTMTVPASTPTGVLWVSFSSFSNSGGTGADFSDVGAIELSIEGDMGTDLQIDSLSTGLVTPIPEPQTFLLTGLGILTLLGRRRVVRASD
jgi:hypothetical protein